jgi:hypothetical protein
MTKKTIWLTMLLCLSCRPSAKCSLRFEFFHSLTCVVA